MDVLEFAKEHKRMCHSFAGDNCTKCPAASLSSCNSIINLKKLVPIVEKWSKENPKVTNLDHFAETFEKLGYKVNKRCLKTTCPEPYTFYGFVKCPAHLDCEECRKWWLEEYKGEEE